MKLLLTSGLAGLVFGAGLLLSGMTDANKVIGFLDMGGAWDPSLAFVMAGAIGVHMVLYRLILRRPSPLFASHFGIPTRTLIDHRLVMGAALFGVGWGLGGYCPGPGIVSATSGTAAPLVFMGTLVVGMWLFKVVDRTLRSREPSARSDDRRRSSARPVA